MPLDSWFDPELYAEWYLVVAAVVGLLLFAGLYRVVTRAILGRTGDSLWSTLIERVYVPVVATAVAAVVVFAVGFLDRPDLAFGVSAGVLTVVVVLWAYALVSIGNEALRGRDTDRLKFAPVLANVFTVIVLIIVVFLLLDIWGIDITPLLASAGILGVVIGFAARDTISNFAAGISLYFDRTFVVGDFISLPGGERGTVVDISIRSTTILTRDNVTVTVPNAEFNRQNVVNETAPVRPRRIRLDVGVAYGSDLAAVDAAMIEATEAVPLVSDHHPPKVRFQSFDDSAIVAQLQCYIEHPASHGAAVDQLIREIDANFEAAGVKIPFPQRELTFFEAGNTVRVADDRSAPD